MGWWAGETNSRARRVSPAGKLSQLFLCTEMYYPVLSDKAKNLLLSEDADDFLDAVRKVKLVGRVKTSPNLVYNSLKTTAQT